MARFDNNVASAVNVKFSPDQRYFAVMTSRGIIRSNSIESTVRLFSADAVRAFLQGGDRAKSPTPKIVARWAAIPQIYYPTSYEPVITNLQWLPDSKKLLFLAQNSDGKRQIFSTDITSGTLRALTPRGRDVVQFRLVTWRYNRTSTIGIDYKTLSEQHALGRVRANADAFDVTGLSMPQILFPEENQDDNEPPSAEQRYFLTLIGSKPIDALQRKPNVIKPLSIAVQQDLNVSPALWVSNSQTKKTKMLWDPNPQLAKMNLGEASVFRWKDEAGYKWVAGLVKPPDYVPGKRYPLVIQTHGFFSHFVHGWKDGDEFTSDGIYTTAFAARPLASAGIIVLQMPMNWDHVVTSKEAIDQIRGFESGIAQLDARGLIDPKRVGIIGFSRTCWYVESALITKPELFAAASVTDGVDQSYMQYLLFGDLHHGHFRDESNQIYGATPFGKGISSWVKEAPGFNIDRIQTPLLIGAIGSESLLLEWETYASLQMQKKPVELVYIPDGQHILQKPLDRLASQQGNVDWFRFWLQGYEDPDPAKATQYKRWETLRGRQKR